MKQLRNTCYEYLRTRPDDLASSRRTLPQYTLSRGSPFRKLAFRRSYCIVCSNLEDSLVSRERRGRKESRVQELRRRECELGKG